MVCVHPANIQDRDGARLLLTALRTRFGWLRCIWADGGYAGTLVDWVRALRPRRGTRLEIVKHGTKLSHFKLLPRRWIVERRPSVKPIEATANDLGDVGEKCRCMIY